jgi:amino acid adenylation domain-containing protein
LQVSVDDAQTFRDVAAQTQDRLWHDMDHARYTGVEVLRDLAREKGAAGGVLVPVIYTAAPQLPDGNDASAGVAARELGEVTRAINQTSQVWLDNHVSEQDGELVCDWDSVVNLFPAEMSANMLAAYMRCLEELADNPGSWDQPLSWLSSLTVTADELAMRAANYHELAIPERPVHADIMAQAHKRPQATAVIAGGRQLCYADLDAESSAWAACLLEQGVAEGDRVVVAMEKGWEQIVAVLAVLRAGGIYVPVDPAVPDERLAWLVEKSHAAIVLTQPALVADRVWPQAAKVVEVSSELPQERVAVPPVPEYVPADAIACVIFTSGSTGLPKGVMLTHRGIMSCVIPTVAEFNIDSADCAFGITALHHDLSLFDVFGILGAGGKLVLPDPAGRRDPAHWAELVNQHSVTLWNSVPAMLEMFLEYAEQHAGAVPPSLRNVWLGGDWVPVDIPQRLKAQNAAAQLVTIGGPTETTIWNIWYPVTAVNPDWKSIPYGRPIANTRYYILDEQMQECPDWVTGMMYASGPGVTLGYLDEPELTAAKYVSHPETGARMFCTGDQGRWRGDGTIEFIGRADFQLKIQGQRIEPGEIESALRSHADVAQVVVTAVGEKRGRKQLIAYIVPVAGKSVIDDAAIRDFLASKLPPYMVPPVFITLQELPLTANGKIDRAALPLPDFSSSVQTGDADGDSEIVARVTALVADVLNIEISDPGVNLMSLGANSIDMVRIGNRLEAEFGSRPRMDEIFRLQSTRALAGWYEPAESAKAEQAKPAQSSGSEVVDRIVAETRVMIEPEERDAFKDSRPGVRKDIAGRLLVDLPREVTDEMRERYRSRRSCRNFSLKPVKLQDLSDFVGCLAELSLGENKHKFLYASPGGLNPIQLYLHVKPGRVEGLAEGTYYYHPEQHALMQIAEIAELDRDMHIPFINTPIFDECAFSLFLIADLGSIVPAYGDRSMHFISLEVGAISQLLDMYAAEANIGICHIGTIEFERIAEYFDLKQSHICVHSMVGGAPASSEAAAENESAAGKASDILRRVRELSDQEARTLLDSQKRADGEG